MRRWLYALLASLAFMLSPTGVATAGVTPTDPVILVLDASGSMKGEKMTSAVEVGKTFLTTVPAGIKVGLVTFNSRDIAVIPPTLDFNVLSEALSAVKPEGNTSLYDGILSAIDSIESGSTARIVVLTDGDDTASKSIPAEVVSAITSSKVSLDVVTVGDATKEIDVLQEFSQAGGGRLLQTKDAAQLTDVFTKVLASPPPVPTPTAVVPTPTVAEPVIVESNSTALDRALRGAAITVLVVLALFVGVRIFKRRKDTQKLDDALDPYATTLLPHEASNQKSRSEFEPSDRKNRRPKHVTVALTKSQYFPGIADKLDRAGIAMSAERWIISWTLGSLLLTFGLMLISDSIAISATLALLTTFFIQNTFLKSREGALKREFEERLADFLTIIASGLRAGLSFAQAVESAVGDGSGEVERQIRRALAEVQVGSTLDAALMRVAKKMDSDDLSWTIAALRIQREVGGNLSKILDTAAVTIRNRAELKREIRTLSAEGRMSAYVLVALPLGIFGFLLLSRRDYVKIFWTETIGMVMLAMFVILVTAGWFWIRSVVTVRV